MIKWQTYYRTKLETLSNVCDMSVPLAVNCVGAVDETKEFDTVRKRKDFYLIYMLQGSMPIEYGDKTGNINKGEFIVLKPGTIHRNFAKVNSGINYLWIHFTGSEAENMLLEYSIPLNTICRVGYSGGLEDCWRKLCREFVMNDAFFVSQSNALLTEFLGRLARLLKGDNSAKRLVDSLFYIHENYHKKISVQTLADMVGVSEPHYRALFVKSYGKSPVDYITERRINGVEYLLDNTDKTLEEIAELTGFCDAYYMTRQFKKIMGTTPGKYRRNS